MNEIENEDEMNQQEIRLKVVVYWKRPDQVAKYLLAIR